MANDPNEKDDDSSTPSTAASSDGAEEAFAEWAANLAADEVMRIVDPLQKRIQEQDATIAVLAKQVLHMVDHINGLQQLIEKLAQRVDPAFQLEITSAKKN